MSTVPADQIGKKEHDELCCVYSALILHDDGQEVNADNINKLIKSSNNTVDSYWPASFARALKGKSIGDLLMNISSGAPAAAAAAPAEAGTQDAGKEKQAEKEEDVQQDVDMGNLFGGDDEEDY